MLRQVFRPRPAEANRKDQYTWVFVCKDANRNYYICDLEDNRLDAYKDGHLKEEWEVLDDIDMGYFDEPENLVHFLDPHSTTHKLSHLFQRAIRENIEGSSHYRPLYKFQLHRHRLYSGTIPSALSSRQAREIKGSIRVPEEIRLLHNPKMPKRCTTQKLVPLSQRRPPDSQQPRRRF